MASTLLRPLEFGETIDGAFSLYRAHFRTLFATSLIVAIPGPIVAAMLAALGGGDPVGLGTAAFVLTIAVATGLAWGALTWQTARAVEGAPFTVGEGFSRGGGALIRLLLAAVAVYLAALVVLLPAMLGVGLLAALLGALPDGGSVALAALFAVFGMGAVVVGVSAMFAVPAAVVIEGRGPIGAMRRSWSLARGALPRISALVLLAWLIGMLPTLGLYAVGAGSGAFSLSPDAVRSPLWAVIETAGTGLIGALTYPFLIAALTLQYFDRRVRVEAYDLEVATDALVVAD